LLRMDAADAEKKLRAVRKKLQQIEKLKEKKDQLDEDARKKLATEPDLQREAAALELQIGGGSAKDAPPPKAAEPPPPATQAVEPPPPTKKAAKSKPKQAPAPAKAQEAALVSVPPAPQGAPEPERTGPSLEQEKQIQKLKKKLGQIAKLKEKGDPLDPEAQQKLASEAKIHRDIELLQKGQNPPVEEEKPRSTGAEEEPEREEPQREDPHAAARAEQLEAPPPDLGLLIDDETEKRFKNLQKKLRDIGKLHDQAKIDKLQEAKLQAEPGIIEELAGIRALAVEKLASRRAAAAETAKHAPAPKAKQTPHRTAQAGGPSWECPNCGKTGEPSELGESDCCPHCGFEPLIHFVPKREEEEGDGEYQDDEDKEAKASKKRESQDLKTAGRRKAQTGASSKQGEGGGQPAPSRAAWPELKEVLESGECGVDKSRQKKGILVDRPKSEPPYDVFDSVLLRCDFLSRVELRLAPTVLEQESFMLYFPGNLSDSMLELILKGNKLSTVPPGIGDFSRIRSIDLSHNAISALPSLETWAKIAETLELLDISFNKLESIAALEPLSKLSSLKLDANQLISMQGLTWKAVKQLSTLTAVGNVIEELPEAVGECSESLTHLDVSENRITVVPTAIKDLRKLKSLSLAGNPIKDQKAVNNAEKGIKDLKAYLTKMAPKRKAK